MVTKQKKRRLVGIEKERKRKPTVDDNKAKATARKSVLNQPSLAEQEVDEDVDEEVHDLHTPHVFHEL